MMLGNVLAGVGAVLLLIGQIWIAIIAFRHGFLWFLVVFCVPFAALLFVALHFEETKTGVIAYLLGLAVSVAGGYFVSRAERQRALLQQYQTE